MTTEPDSPTRTCVVLQPGYLPWLGFFEQLYRADAFVYLDDVQFDKHGWRNRNQIKGPSGAQWLTVPVRISGLKQPRINDVLIDRTKANWASKHLKSLSMNYGATPFFDWLYPELAEMLTRAWTNLAELDIALVDLLCAKMSLSRQIERSSALNISGRRNERLIEICRHFDCRTYYTGAAAQVYLDVRAFRNAGIEPVFQDYVHPTYPQRYGSFVSHLSVVDLLFNCGPQSLDVLLSGALTAVEVG